MYWDASLYSLIVSNSLLNLPICLGNRCKVNIYAFNDSESFISVFSMNLSMRFGFACSTFCHKKCVVYCVMMAYGFLSMQTQLSSSEAVCCLPQVSLWHVCLWSVYMWWCVHVLFIRLWRIQPNHLFFFLFQEQDGETLGCDWWNSCCHGCWSLCTMGANFRQEEKEKRWVLGFLCDLKS